MKKIVFLVCLLSAEFAWATVGPVKAQVSHPTYSHRYEYH